MTDKPLSGKTAVVFGVANKRSIAWAIAQAWADAGARLILNYQSERIRANVEQLASSLGPDALTAPCDVTSDDEIRAFFEVVRAKAGACHLLLHSVAFAPKQTLEGRFLNTSREAFLLAQNVSVYSLIGCVREARPLMPAGASIVTLSFYGAEKVFPHYNVMGVAKASLEATVRYLAADLGPEGIRVNAISAGPVNTLAARGISGFTKLLQAYNERAPLRRTCELTEVGHTALFLATPASGAITGQTLYVDGGYQIIGI